MITFIAAFLGILYIILDGDHFQVALISYHFSQTIDI